MESLARQHPEWNRMANAFDDEASYNSLNSDLVNHSLDGGDVMIDGENLTYDKLEAKARDVSRIGNKEDFEMGY